MWHFSRYWRIYRIYDWVYNNWQPILYVWCWPAYYSWQVGEPLLFIVFHCNLWSETLSWKNHAFKTLLKGATFQVLRSSWEQLFSLFQCWRLRDSDVFHWQSASSASYRSNRVFWGYAFPFYWRDGKVLCIWQEGKGSEFGLLVYCFSGLLYTFKRNLL